MLNLSALAFKSLRNRSLTVGMTVLSISLSVALLIGVERMRRETHESFSNTVSGTDLIVGARTGSLQLLLSSVFRIGDASNNISWESYEMLQDHPAVEWTIPVSLGDSHQGYRVMGTSGDYFDHFRYGRKQNLKLSDGAWFASDDEAVIGSEVAAKLGYGIADQLVVAHGAGDVSFIEHEEHPFTIIGILAPTGTPVDRTVHVDLSGITAIHAGMEGGGCAHSHDPLHVCSHGHHGAAEPEITAAFIGLKSRAAALSVQRMVNEYEDEALSAILPSLALQELWDIVGVVEKVLLTISFFVIAVGLAGMMTALMTSLNERRREMAILRSVGARPGHILGLIAGEAVGVTISGVITGFLLVYGLTIGLRSWAASALGLHLSIAPPSLYELVLGTLIIIAGALVGLIPAYRSYRYSLADGLTIRT
jgi:putative ABC transport system permease protein